MSGELEALLGGMVKMTIEKWKVNDSFSFLSDDVFELMLNPEQYSEELINSYHQKKSEAQRLSPMSKPKDNKLYTFEFIIDGTGATGTLIDVYTKIQEFKKLTVDRKQKDQNCSLRLRWGTLHMKCNFLSASITYTLFSRTGLPLRAKVNARFERLETLPPSDLARGEQDIRKVVGGGQSLISLTNEVYGSPKNMAALARANKLNSLRSIKSGLKVFFPPKSSM